MARGEPRRGTPADLLVIGLGNPGGEYAGTRHNVGAEAVELLAQRHDGRLKASRDAPALVAELRIASSRVAAALPTTFMNDSGRAVAPLCRRFGIEEFGALVVVHDELDLPPGVLRVKVGGGLAGHNGLRSITAHIHSSDYVRVRIGVGKPRDGARGGVDHVLSVPSRRDREAIDVTVHEAVDAIEMILAKGAPAAMAHYNRSRDAT